MIILAAAFLFAAADMEAQVGKRYYINGGWQFNGTPGNTYSETASGWGAYAESGCYLLPKLAVGVFASFNTNNEYVPRKVYPLPEGAALSTDLTRSLFQLPFGATLRYRFMRSKLQPYMEAKVGANYSSEHTYFSTMVMSDSQWGFYASPEFGLTWHPFDRSNFGFQFAVYYSYATNSSKSFKMNGINNCGFKLGVSF